MKLYTYFLTFFGHDVLLTEERKKEYFIALVERDSSYEGIFFYAVATTGTFCRPTCPSRKPKIENCHFFKTIEEAKAIYRPCLRCNPILLPNAMNQLVETFLSAIDENPDQIWREEDFAKMGANSITVRRQFKRRFGMTFVGYLRMCRLEIALNQIKSGKSVIEIQQSLGYESSSGLRDAFYRLFGASPLNLKQVNILKASLIDTPFGPMKAIASDRTLQLLDFVDSRDIDKKTEGLRKESKAIICPGISSPIQSIEQELSLYFKGKLKTFKTPIEAKSEFNEVLKIPFGETRAVSISKNSNRFAIVVPFHRILGEQLSRNQGLLNHEQSVLKNEVI